MCHCWWTSESPRAHVAKFYCRLRLIRSVWRASNFSVFKLIEIVILWVYDTILFGFSLFWHVLVITFQLFILHVLLRVTDEGSVSEMRIWSISLIYFNQKWCKHLSRSLYWNFKPNEVHVGRGIYLSMVQMSMSLWYQLPQYIKRT